MRSDRSLATLVGARCLVEAVLFTALAAVAHAATQGREALPVLPTALTVFGAALLLCTVLRELGTERRSATVIVITLAVGVGWGLMLPMRGADGFSVLSRITLFGLLTEAALWRVVSVARGPARWTDARNAMPVTGIAIAIAVLGPGTIDRGAFAPLALLVL
ncbi:MAG: hypothetical protein AAB295_03230, partial [Chloroflexota bacterium]